MSRRNLGRGNTIKLVLFLRASLLCSGTASLGTSSILLVSEKLPNISDKFWTIVGNWNLSVVSTCEGWCMCNERTFTIINKNWKIGIKNAYSQLCLVIAVPTHSFSSTRLYTCTSRKKECNEVRTYAILNRQQHMCKNYDTHCIYRGIKVCTLMEVIPNEWWPQSKVKL